MSERVNKDIDIQDLPPDENLMPAEKERLTGVGRFRPMFEALEARELMDAGIGHALVPMAPTGGDAYPEAGHVRTLSATPQSQPSVVRTGAVLDTASSTVEKSSDQEDIRRKLEQIKQVVEVLKPMDVASLPYAQWLDGQSQKNQLLMGADTTELSLKQSEIDKLKSQLKSHPEKATVLALEEAELAVMKDKMAKMTELQTAIEQAQQGKPGADQRVADLTLKISQDELMLKNLQVATLQYQVMISPPDKQPALQKLMEGEQYEVEQLKQIVALNQQIADRVGSGGDATTVVDLRRQVVQHELLMKEQNMRQLEARLKPEAA
jgi:hypothetical protein